MVRIVARCYWSSDEGHGMDFEMRRLGLVFKITSPA